MEPGLSRTSSWLWKCHTTINSPIVHHSLCSDAVVPPQLLLQCMGECGLQRADYPLLLPFHPWHGYGSGHPQSVTPCTAGLSGFQQFPTAGKCIPLLEYVFQWCNQSFGSVNTFHKSIKDELSSSSEVEYQGNYTCFNLQISQALHNSIYKMR